MVAVVDGDEFAPCIGIGVFAPKSTQHSAWAVGSWLSPFQLVVKPKQCQEFKLWSLWNLTLVIIGSQVVKDHHLDLDKALLQDLLHHVRLRGLFQCPIEGLGSVIKRPGFEGRRARHISVLEHGVASAETNSNKGGTGRRQTAVLTESVQPLEHWHWWHITHDSWEIKTESQSHTQLPLASWDRPSLQILCL